MKIAMMPLLVVGCFAVDTGAASQVDTEGRLTRVMRPQIERYLDNSGPFCGKLSIDGGNGKLLYYRPEHTPPAEQLKKFEALIEAGVLRPYRHPDRPEWVWFERVGEQTYAHPGLICYGERKFAGIVEFTPERRIECWRLRDVRYRYRVTKVPDWARRSAVVAAFPNLPRFEGEMIEGRLPMMFLNGGWQLHDFDPVHALYLCDE